MTISTRPHPIGRECECATCGERFLNLDAFDAHLPADPVAPLTCARKGSQEARDVDDFGAMGGSSGDFKGEPLTRGFAPENVNAEASKATARHGARGALTLKAQKRCRKGHLKAGTGRCSRCQAEWQARYRAKGQK